mgnify:CR=1 FL=1
MMNKQQDFETTPKQHFIRQDRLRLFVELAKCKKELASSLQVNQDIKLSYQTIVITLIIINILTYGALLYVRYSQTPFV